MSDSSGTYLTASGYIWPLVDMSDTMWICLTVTLLEDCSWIYRTHHVAGYIWPELWWTYLADAHQVCTGESTRYERVALFLIELFCSIHGSILSVYRFCVSCWVIGNAWWADGNSFTGTSTISSTYIWCILQFTAGSVMYTTELATFVGACSRGCTMMVAIYEYVEVQK